MTQILAHAGELARRFQNADLSPGRTVDAASLRAVRTAFQAKAAAEQDLYDAVSVARAEDHSWALIGAMLGTCGEAARRRYGTTSRRPPRPPPSSAPPTP